MRKAPAIAAGVALLLSGAAHAAVPAPSGPGSLPIPIATADLAAAAGLHRDDPSTLGLDIVRLAFASPDGTTDGDPAPRDAVIRALNSGGSVRGRLPLPLTAATWRTHVLQESVPDERLAAAIFGNRATALLYFGLMGMDPATLAWIDANPGVLDAMVAHPGATAGFARSIHVRDGKVVTPGEHADDVWLQLVDADPRLPATFIPKLLAARNGRTAVFYDTIAHLDAAHQRFAIGAAADADRIARARRLLDAAARESPSWRVDDRPFTRSDVDAAGLLRLVAVDESGVFTGPSSRRLWARVFGVREGGDGRVDAPWLAGAILDAGGSARRRLDTLLFAQRALAGSGTSEDAVISALEAFLRYPALMLTLEGNGTTDAVAYANAGKAAERLGRDDDVLGVFQSSVAILDMSRRAGTLPAAQARAEIATLSAAAAARPLRASLLAWISNDLLPTLASLAALQPAPHVEKEALVLQAIAGPTSVHPPTVTWEGQRYTVDLAATTFRRLVRVRREQQELSLDKALGAATPRDLTPLAQSLAGIVYATAMGEPDSQALNGGAVWRRHRFGPDALGQSDSGAAWRLATEVFGAGGWHLVGSLLRLDVALAHLALRRIDSTEIPGPSLLSTTDRRTLAISVALIDPQSITDAERDAVAGAIARGRERITDLPAHPGVFDAIAQDAGISEWRQNAIRWRLANDPSGVPAAFTMLELFRLGGDTRSHAWGAAALPLDGCLCLRMPDRLPWEEYAGRASTGQLATQLADVNLRAAEVLAARRLPALLVRDVAAFAMQQVIDAAHPAYFDDWLPVAFAARDIADDRWDDYVAALTAAGPLLPTPRTPIQ